MSEAAGRAARLAVRDGDSPSHIDPRELQRDLGTHGAYLREQPVPVAG